MKKYWFKSKSFGWGWTPCSREGWLVTIGFVLAAIAIGIIFKEQLERGKVTDYFISLGGLIILLVIIAFKTGEKPKWNWGKKQ